MRLRKHNKILITSISIIIGILIVCFLVSYLGFFSKNTRFAFTNTDKIILFAHRGQTNSFPENTYESVAAAQSQGFNGVEIDVRDTKDNELVLFHDESMKRLLGIDKNLDDEVFSEIEKTNIIWKKKKTSSKVVKLEKIFQDFPNLYYYIDFKTPSDKNVEILVNLIKKYKLEDKVIIAHAKLFKQIKFKIKHSEIANSLEGFNSGNEVWLKFLPKKFRPDFYSSFIYMTDSKQINFFKEKGLLNRRIVYDVTKDNINKALNEYGLQYLIIDIDSIPHDIKLNTIY